MARQAHRIQALQHETARDIPACVIIGCAQVKKEKALRREQKQQQDTFDISTPSAAHNSSTREKRDLVLELRTTAKMTLSLFLSLCISLPSCQLLTISRTRLLRAGSRSFLVHFSEHFARRCSILARHSAVRTGGGLFSKCRSSSTPPLMDIVRFCFAITAPSHRSTGEERENLGRKFSLVAAHGQRYSNKRTCLHEKRSVRVGDENGPAASITATSRPCRSLWIRIINQLADCL